MKKKTSYQKYHNNICDKIQRDIRNNFDNKDKLRKDSDMSVSQCTLRELEYIILKCILCRLAKLKIGQGRNNK